VQQIASQLEYFVAENAKTARAFLKLVPSTIRWRARCRKSRSRN
jgi:hypothetical protein